MKILFLSLFSLSLWGQYSEAANSPDCFISHTFTAVGRSNLLDNRNLGCDTWRVQVQNLSNATVAYDFERSRDSTSFITVSSGNTISATSATSTTFVTDSEFVSVSLTSKGTGNVVVVITGYSYKKGKNPAKFGGPESVGYTILIDPASATISYVCTAKSIFDPDVNTTYPICQITRITKNGSGVTTKVQNANGSIAEDQVWGDRASLTYK